MTITGITLTDTTTTQTDAEIATTGLADDFDSFLTLLTTQLQQQDPTEPMDTNTFTEQIIQFTSVEQAVKTNSNLEELISLTTQQYSGVDQGTAVNYLGKYVTIDSSTQELTGSSLEWLFGVDSGAVMATVGIYDSSGTLVNIEEVGLSGEEGAYVYDWDGTDSTGAAVANGDYTVAMVAFDETGAEVNITTNMGGTVTAIDFSDGEYVIRLENGSRYDLEKVIMVEDTPLSTDEDTELSSDEDTEFNTDEDDS